MFRKGRWLAWALSILLGVGIFRHLTLADNLVEVSSILRRTEIQSEAPIRSDESTKPKASRSTSAPVDPRILAAEDFLASDSFSLALPLVEDCLVDMPESPRVRRNASLVYLGLAIQASTQGNNRTALSFAQQAMDMDGLKGAPHAFYGQVLLQLGRHQEAELHLQESMERYPENPEGYYFGIRSAFLLGNYAEAVRRAERALSLRPSWASAQTWLERARNEEETWRSGQRWTSAHFICVTSQKNASLISLAPYVSEALESAVLMVEQELGVSLDEPVLVLLSPTADFQAGAPSWASGLYDGRIRLPVEEDTDADVFEATLLHEVTHAVLHRSGFHLPTWLGEGLAQWMEGKDVSRARRRLQDAAQAGQLPSAAALREQWVSWSSQSRVQHAYDFALSLTAWIQEEYGQEVLRNVLNALQQNDLKVVSQRLLGLPFSVLEQRHRHWLEETVK